MIPLTPTFAVLMTLLSTTAHAWDHQHGSVVGPPPARSHVAAPAAMVPPPIHPMGHDLAHTIIRPATPPVQFDPRVPEYGAFAPPTQPGAPPAMTRQGSIPHRGGR
jgi:hypothetical protein